MAITYTTAELVEMEKVPRWKRFQELEMAKVPEVRKVPGTVEDA